MLRSNWTPNCWVCRNIFLVHWLKLAETTRLDDRTISYCDSKFNDIPGREGGESAVAVGANKTDVQRQRKLEEFLLLEKIIIEGRLSNGGEQEDRILKKIWAREANFTCGEGHWEESWKQLFCRHAVMCSSILITAMVKSKRINYLGQLQHDVLSVLNVE